MTKKLLILTTLLLVFTTLFAGCGSDEASEPTEETIFCAQDVRICSDGSSVSRVPPTCEFAACSNSNSSNPSSMSDTPTITLAEIKALSLDCSSEDSELQTACPAVADLVAKVKTTSGTLWIRLFPNEAPKTVENFAGLAERGYYNGLIFHRVIPDFMIQGGDPNGNGTGGTSIWGTEFADEFSPRLKNIHGALAMANRGPHTNGSQFFIVQAAEGTPWLDFHHTVFGQVFSGIALVDGIALVPRDGSDKPLTPIKMETVEVFKVVK